MNKRTQELSQWCAKNRYEFSPDAEDFSVTGARELDCFRSWDSADSHVSGTYRNHAFEMLDVTRYHGGRNQSYTCVTSLLLPGVTSTLPDFRLLPRGAGRIMAYFGLPALDLAMSPTAPRDATDAVADFNRLYSLYSGGMQEYVAAMDSPVDRASNLSEISAICKPRVLRFLSQHPGRSVEFQNGFLVISEARERLSGTDRTELLAFAIELVELLLQAGTEAPIRGLTLQNTAHRGAIKGVLIGVFSGFFLGFLVSLGLMFINTKLIILAPVGALCGAISGGFIGGKLAARRAN